MSGMATDSVPYQRSGQARALSNVRHLPDRLYMQLVPAGGDKVQLIPFNIPAKMLRPCEAREPYCARGSPQGRVDGRPAQGFREAALFCWGGGGSNQRGTQCTARRGVAAWRASPGGGVQPVRKEIRSGEGGSGATTKHRRKRIILAYTIQGSTPPSP